MCKKFRTVHATYKRQLDIIITIVLVYTTDVYD